MYNPKSCMSHHVLLRARMQSLQATERPAQFPKSLIIYTEHRKVPCKINKILQTTAVFKSSPTVLQRYPEATLSFTYYKKHTANLSREKGERPTWLDWMPPWTVRSRAADLSQVRSPHVDLSSLIDSDGLLSNAPAQTRSFLHSKNLARAGVFTGGKVMDIEQGRWLTSQLKAHISCFRFLILPLSKRNRKIELIVRLLLFLRQYETFKGINIPLPTFYP